MKTKILVSIAFFAAVGCSAEIYRIVCPSCSVTNVIAPTQTLREPTALPDTPRQVNRKIIKTTKVFTCTNCSNAILSVSRQVVGQTITDIKPSQQDTETYISSHPVIIKPPKVR